MSEDLTQPIITEQRKTPIVPILFTIFQVVLISIAGFFGYQNFLMHKQIAKLSIQPVPTPIPTIPVDPIASWETYVNETYGINIKYPDEFTYTSSGPNLFQQQINQGKQISGTIAPSYDTVRFTNGGKNFDLGIFHTQTILGDGNFDGSCGTQFAEKTLINTQEKINNFPYRRILESDKGNQSLYYCFLSGNNNLMVLSVVNNSPDNIDYYNYLFNKILSTFRFVD